jgi:hypothetical protein
MAAPMATTSSGFTPWCGSFPNNSFTFATTAGMRVMPPTKTTSWISFLSIFASFKAFKQGFTVFSISCATSASSFPRVSFMLRCLGPDASAVMNGRLISVSVAEESSIFAFSAASLRRWMAILSCERSTPWSFLNSARIHSMISLSKSSPPKCVSPLVDTTSNTPSPNSSTDTSNVPPPKS